MSKRILLSVSVCLAAGAAMVAVGQELTVQSGGPAGYAVYSLKTNPHDETQLNAKIGEVVQQYLAAKEDDAKRAARDKLQTALGDLFDVRQKEREEEIKEIEARVTKLRETLKEREAKRQDLIEHRLTTLIEDAKGLGWGNDGAAGNALYYRTPMMIPPAGGGRVIETRPLPAPPGVAPRRE